MLHIFQIMVPKLLLNFTELPSFNFFGEYDLSPEVNKFHFNVHHYYLVDFYYLDEFL